MLVVNGYNVSVEIPSNLPHLRVIRRPNEGFMLHIRFLTEILSRRYPTQGKILERTLQESQG